MFYKGIVEDNLDDEKLGRVKVRIIGKHSTNRTEVSQLDDYYPTEDLPWAMPIFPAGASSISGTSVFSVPSINSVVVCGFFDPDEQELFYIGTLALTGTTKVEGFGIEEDDNPKTEYPLSELVNNESDVYENELVTNPLFDEPEVAHVTVYPNTNIIQTKSGHIVEYDDSEGTERIRIRHMSGTFEEYHNNGDNIQKAIKDKYSIATNVNTHAKENRNSYVGVDDNLIVDGNKTDEVTGNENVTIGGDRADEITGELTVEVGGNVTLNVTGNVDVTAGGNVTVTAPMIYHN